jgi:protein involved in polysaccharide export with SLBB domain
MLRILAGVVVVALSLVGGGILGAQPPGSSRPVPDEPSFLRPGDAVRVRIWREPDLSGDFEINESGTVVLPRIGPVLVTGISSDSVRAQLFERFRVLLSHNSIEIALLRRVQILGAVRNPGLYPLDPTMTIGDAVAVAGGATTAGSQKQVQLVRRGERLARKLSYHTRVSDSPIRSGDQIFVPERSWLVRHENLIAVAATSAVSLLIARTR